MNVRACVRAKRHVNALFKRLCYDAHQSACLAEHKRTHARVFRVRKKNVRRTDQSPVRWHICRCRYVYYWTHGENGECCGDADAVLQAIGMHAHAHTHTQTDTHAKLPDVRDYRSQYEFSEFSVFAFACVCACLANVDVRFSGRIRTNVL